MILGVHCLLILYSFHCASADNINFPTRPFNTPSYGEVWPKPQSIELKNEYVGIAETFALKVIGKTCNILDSAIERYYSILETNWRKLTKYEPIVNGSNIGKTSVLNINLKKDCEEYPHLDMDEKYQLEIKGSSCFLISESIWGILRGLETFSQLPLPTQEGDQLILQIQKIEDWPQFSHRGLLIDTSRHYLPVATIKKQLDIMSYNKLNVLHWHMVDDQSFPYQSAKFPSLSEKGSFHPTEAIYTEDTIKSIVEHARLRGIRVVPEFDSPGHTDSFAPGLPDLHCRCPYPDDREMKKLFLGPFDPTKNSTYAFVKDLFTEVHHRFPERYIHIGGDEVDPYCWRTNKDIKNFMDSNKWDAEQLQSYYEQNVLKIVKDGNMRSIVWQEVFDDWENLHGEKSMTMDKDTIVQVWKGDTPEGSISTIRSITSKGYKLLNSVGWYLDVLSNDFFALHAIDLHNLNLTKEEKKLIVGGETCMWGEKVDETNIEARVWPRACAAAEKLWSSPQHKYSEVDKRISEHICRLKRREVHSEPAKDISFCAPVMQPPSHVLSSVYSKYFYSIKESLGFGRHDENEHDYKIVLSKPTSTVMPTHAPARVHSTVPAAVIETESHSDAKEKTKSAASSIWTLRFADLLGLVSTWIIVHIQSFF